MKIIDKYTLKQVVVSFMLVLISMTVLVWLTQSLRMIDMIVTKGVSVGLFLELTVLVLPNFLQVLSPLALFAVVLFTLIRMQSDKELMVMQAVGMSPKNIMRPVFKLAFILTLCGYVFSVFLIPMSNNTLREMKWKIRNDISHLLLQEGQFNSFNDGLTLYVKERLADGNVKGVFAYEQKKPNQRTILSAQDGSIFQEPDGLRIVLYNGTRQEFHPDSKQFSILKFDKYTMTLADKAPAANRKPDVRELSLSDLWNKTLEGAEGNKPYWRKHKVEFVKRLTQPLYNITYIFLAIFGILSGYYNRRGQVGRINTTVIAALIIQSFALLFENMSGKNLWFLILLVLNVFTPLLFVYKFPITERLLAKLTAGLFMLIIVLPGNAANLKMGSVDTKAPVDFEADDVSYNYKKETMKASGNVILKQDSMIVETDQILYDRGQNKITAPNKVTITTKEGSVAHMQGGTMSGDLSTAQMGKTDVYLYDGSTFGADEMERVENGDSYLREATYTPCDVCEGKSALWRLRAKTIHHDAEAQDLIYKNILFDVKDFPVAYMPYWRMPDFSVKRRTGFLSPSFKSTHEMRNGLALPVFMNLSDNQSLTVTPIVSPEHMPLGILSYQGLFTKGVLNLDASGTKDKDGKKSLSGHIKADFNYDVTESWRLSGQYVRASSDTYFRRYDIPGVDDSDPFLMSHLTAERFGNRNYFKFKNYAFQSLRSQVSSKNIPVLLPTLDFSYNTKPLNGYGLYSFTKINSALFNTRNHFKSNRLSITEGLTVPYITPFGAAIDLTGFVRADGYAIDSGRFGFTGKSKNESYNTGRIYSNLSATFRYPLMYSDETASHIIEPMAMVVVAPNGGNPDKIPNVDSLVFDFDDTNLFSANRFSGYDRVEPGTHVNYGIRWARFNRTSGRSISALIGQSFRLDDDELMAGLMGYRSHLSDYVARVKIDGKYLSLHYRTRLDRKNLKAQKSEVGVTAGTAPLKFGLSYVKRSAYKIGSNSYNASEEIVYSAYSQFSKNWSLSGEYRYDLSGRGEPVKSGAVLRYDNECTALIFDITRDFTEDRDYKGDTSFSVKLLLKTLGGM